MKVSVEEKLNQVRHMILTIAGKATISKTDIDLTNLLKILIKNSNGSIKNTAKKLLSDKNTYLTVNCWMVMICKQLSLDHDENSSVLSET